MRVPASSRRWGRVSLSSRAADRVVLSWTQHSGVDLNPPVARRIELAETNSALDDVRTGRATRTVIIHPH